MKISNQLLALTGLSAALTALAGCGGISPLSSVFPGPTTSAQGGTQPIPRVQNCGVLDAGTPSRFVCNGKVYTSYQLATLRENEAKKYASSK